MTSYLMKRPALTILEQADSDHGGFNGYGFDNQTNALGNYPDASVEEGEGEEELIVLRPDEEGMTDEEIQKKREEEGERVPNSEEIEKLRKENEMLRNQQGMVDKLDKGFGSLSETLEKSMNRPNYAPQQQDNRSKEELAKSFEESLFKDGKSYETVDQLVNQRLTQAQQQQMSYMVQQEREILELKDKQGIFDRYGNEIDQMVQQLPPNQQITPGVYKWARQQIIAKHVDDIAGETSRSKLQETLDKIGYTLDEEGNPVKKDEGGSRSTSYSAPTGSGGVGAGQSGKPTKRTKTVRATQEDILAAKANNMELKDYMALKNS